MDKVPFGTEAGTAEIGYRGNDGTDLSCRSIVSKADTRALEICSDAWASRCEGTRGR